jgi:aldose 1-epimerase
MGRNIGRYLILVMLLPCEVLAAGQYFVARRSVEGHGTYHLLDSQRHMDVGIVPDIGNHAYEFLVNGKNVFVPVPSLQEAVEKQTFGWGIPFLAPWANRIAGDSYYFEGKKYLLNGDLGNFRRDNFQQPIHGLLVFDTRWQVVKSGATDKAGAWITSRLEFYKYPDLMAQFPFACVYEMTYRLKDGKLQCSTALRNVGNSDMPVMFAFHPYFHVDGDRSHWVVSNPARKYWLLADHLTPTGETKPASDLMGPDPLNFSLDNGFIDNVFSDLSRDSEGLAHVWVKGQTLKIAVVLDQGFDFTIIYTPAKSDFICIEPQIGPTNVFNLTHEGKYHDLQVLKPGDSYAAAFWVVPSGF